MESKRDIEKNTTKPKDYLAKKQKKLFAGLTALLFVAIVSVGFYCFYHYNDTSATSNSDTDTNSTPNSNNTTNTTTPTVTEYYQNGNTKLGEKDFAGAISDYSAAIAIDSSVPEYFYKKSEAEYSLGRTDEAVKTVEAGLVTNPNDELLKSRRDVLINNGINNSNTDTPRQ